jgi:hypothetical protein
MSAFAQSGPDQQAPSDLASLIRTIWIFRRATGPKRQRKNRSEINV